MPQCYRLLILTQQHAAMDAPKDFIQLNDVFKKAQKGVLLMKIIERLNCFAR